MIIRDFMRTIGNRLRCTNKGGSFNSCFLNQTFGFVYSHYFTTIGSLIEEVILVLINSYVYALNNY